MSFYEREQKAIIQDEADNQLIRTLIKDYQQIKEKYQSTELQNLEFLKEIQELRQINQKLQLEITQLRQMKRSQGTSQPKVNIIPPKQFNKLLLTPQFLSPNLVNKTFQSTLNAQQTKRRVISGFVDQLTQELQQSEDLLKKERFMQEQTRRVLQMCTQEHALLRITIKELESQLTAISLQNQQLLQELQRAVRQKQEIQQKLSLKMLEYKKLKSNFRKDAQQFESELLKMDTIYKNIEVQLQKMK